VVAEHSEVGSDPLVIVLHLSLGLRVIWGGEPLIDAQPLEEVSGVLGSEQGALVRVVDLRDSVESPYIG
jgi:hypothetical protein